MSDYEKALYEIIEKFRSEMTAFREDAKTEIRAQTQDIKEIMVIEFNKIHTELSTMSDKISNEHDKNIVQDMLITQLAADIGGLSKRFTGKIETMEKNKTKLNFLWGGAILLLSVLFTKILPSILTKFTP